MIKIKKLVAKLKESKKSLEKRITKLELEVDLFEEFKSKSPSGGSVDCVIEDINNEIHDLEIELSTIIFVIDFIIANYY